jgi:hypothetical protein
MNINVLDANKKTLLLQGFFVGIVFWNGFG